MLIARGQPNPQLLVAATGRAMRNKRERKVLTHRWTEGAVLEVSYNGSSDSVITKKRHHRIALILC